MNTQRLIEKKKKTIKKQLLEEQNQQILELNSEEEINERESSLNLPEGEGKQETARPRGWGRTPRRTLVLAPGRFCKSCEGFF